MALFVLRASGDSVVLSDLLPASPLFVRTSAISSRPSSVPRRVLPYPSPPSAPSSLSELFTPTVSETWRRALILFVAASRGRHRAAASSSLLINLFAAQIGLLQHLLATHIPTVICVAGSRLSIGLRICNHPPPAELFEPCHHSGRALVCWFCRTRGDQRCVISDVTTCCFATTPRRSLGRRPPAWSAAGRLRSLIF